MCNMVCYGHVMILWESEISCSIDHQEFSSCGKIKTNFNLRQV